jgi:hypothetical protein
MATHGHRTQRVSGRSAGDTVGATIAGLSTSAARAGRKPRHECDLPRSSADLLCVAQRRQRRGALWQRAHSDRRDRRERVHEPRRPRDAIRDDDVGLHARRTLVLDETGRAPRNDRVWRRADSRA